MGSPEFAIPSLKALAENFQVVGVVTQPDKPAGRGQALTPPPVKSAALELGLPVIQPQRLKETEAIAQLQDWQPDLIVVAAFGQILRQPVLELPQHGCVNVHASLLPRWRGAAPIQAALLHGDRETGVTVMCMDPGVDTGPTLAQQSLPIQPGDTAGVLDGRLSHLGARLVLDTLPAYLSGELTPQPQDETRATYAPLLKKEDGELDFTQSAEALERRVRAFNPWPGAYIQWQGQPLKVLRAHIAGPGALRPPVAAGQRCIVQKQPAVGTADGLLVLDEVQPAGKKPMPGKSFLAGNRDWTA
jgi:methionyl-tRNA formyltransferase